MRKGEEFANGVGGPRPAGEGRAGDSAVDARALAAVEPAAGGDAAWFRRRPGRAHRIRRLVDGELPLARVPDGVPERLRLAVVKQVVPGCRVKLALRASRWPCGCEACCATLWERLASLRVRALGVEMAAVMMRAGR